MKPYHLRACDAKTSITNKGMFSAYSIYFEPIEDPCDDDFMEDISS